MKDLKSLAKNIKLVCVDVDGTLTDGQYMVSSDDKVLKTFYTRDFYGLEILQSEDIHIAIVTSSKDDCILAKVMHLPMPAKAHMRLYTNIQQKKIHVGGIIIAMKIGWENVAYVGDAENDLECLKSAGISACPSDAIDEVRASVDFLSKFAGGKGCVYDFSKYLLSLRKA